MKVKGKRHRTKKNKHPEELTAELSAELVPGLGSSRRPSGTRRGAADSLPSFRHIFSCGVKGAKTEGSILVTRITDIAPGAASQERSSTLG